MGHKWRAIALSSFFFGVMHSIFQQSIVTCLVGMVLGFVAIQAGSLLPAITFHAVHNSLTLLTSKYLPDWLARNPNLRWIADVDNDGSVLFSWECIAVSAAASVMLLLWFQRLSYARTDEEKLQETIDQQAAQATS